jgi:small subunit ribosomal protein S20
MADHKSAKSRIIRNAKRSVLNSARKNAIRTAIKKIELALNAGDVDAAKKALQAARPQIQRGAAKHVLDKKAASRKVSRLTSRIKTLDKKA